MISIRVVGRTLIGFAFGQMMGMVFAVIFIPHRPEHTLGENTLVFVVTWLCIGLSWLILFKWWPTRWWP